MHRRTVVALSMTALADCVDRIEEAPQPREAERLTVERINDLRSEVGVAPVTGEEGLSAAARAHSEDMAKQEFYSHTNPDGAGPSDRVACDAVGEVIHRGELGADSTTDATTYNTRNPSDMAGYLVRDWRLSEPHRENLTDPRWTRVGVGIYVTDLNNFLATAVFC